MVHALLPLKDLVSAKSRLSGVLNPSERRALAQAMVEDVLGILTSHPQISRVTLVSDDPGADLLALKYGIDFLDERTLNCRGLNPVLEKSCDRLGATADDLILILHGDIPLLSHSDIDAALERREHTAGLVVGCDRLSQGTNLLLFDAGARPEFNFGPGSCDKHVESARIRGVPVSILSTKAIGLDIDEPADLAQLMTQLHFEKKSHTAQLLLGTVVGKRVEVLVADAHNNPQISTSDETRI
ncbi:MAG: 2-phospho-L-lactate guanylyltransferase [Halioglobus sp.]|jgi:2-phospho-L-lactate guanylyltransferase